MAGVTTPAGTISRMVTLSRYRDIEFVLARIMLLSVR